MSALQHVFDLTRQQEKHQEGKGHDKGCYKKGNCPPKLQRRPLQKDRLQTRNEHAPKRESPNLRTSSKQDNAFPIRLKALDQRRRHPHAGIRSQRYRRQLSVWRHNHQLHTDGALLGPIVNIIHNRLIWFGNNPFNVVDLRRPDWISRSPTTPFQFTRLV